MSFERDLITDLARLAFEAAARSYVPYSGHRSGCVALLSDGTWVPGVRVENASFPLLIPASLNALTTAVAEGRRDFAAFVSSDPISHVERDLLAPFLDGFIVDGNAALRSESLPVLGQRLEAIQAPAIADDLSGVEQARSAASAALTPASDFPVGCLLGSSSSGYVRGVNVEHPDWNLGLCAERNAVGTAISYGLGRCDVLYLSCLKDPSCTPCGACRQVLVEHAPDMRVLLDRSPDLPDATTPADLLPNYFAGDILRSKK
jgi:homotetrameric cytidine deaminase